MPLIGFVRVIVISGSVFVSKIFPGNGCVSPANAAGKDSAVVAAAVTPIQDEARRAELIPRRAEATKTLDLSCACLRLQLKTGLPNPGAVRLKGQPRPESNAIDDEVGLS